MSDRDSKKNVCVIEGVLERVCKMEVCVCVLNESVQVVWFKARRTGEQ